MPLSSQEDHARQSEIHKNRNGAYINMHSLSGYWLFEGEYQLQMNKFLYVKN